ncbi:MAG: GIY-YIG nuclease family protein [Myxococcota bacterium]
MAVGTFDKKFGAQFLAAVPKLPGVYRFYAKNDTVLYVGKAKDLRSRLGQYRTAKRVKAHRKMNRIVKASARLEFELTANEMEALLLENQLIQALRPRFNVAGAFSFMYPSLGMKRTESHLHLAYSTEPEHMEGEGFERFGSYRSRLYTRACFDALEDVFSRLGHKETSSERLPYTAWRRFRQIPQALNEPLRAFFAGESEAFLEQVILSLVEKPDARSDAAAVQARLEELRLFYEVEAQKLRVILTMEGVPYIAQTERDRAAIRAGFKEEDEDEDA